MFNEGGDNSKNVSTEVVLIYYWLTMVGRWNNTPRTGNNGNIKYWQQYIDKFVCLFGV